jgi:hypothetical protein
MECTGQAALNGDLTNTATWAQVKAATPAVLGQIIKRSSGASYQICTTAGAMSASEPAFSDTAGTTTTDTTAVWTSLGAVGSYTGGMAPFARLASACAGTWFANGNTVYVSSNHAESQATAISIAPGVTASTVAKIICHNVSGSYPPTSSDLTTGATVSQAATGALSINPSNGAAYFRGISFRAGVGQSGATILPINGTNAWIWFDNCSFQMATTNNTAGTYIQIGSSNSHHIFWNNCTVKFAGVAQVMLVLSANFVWQNTGQILESGSSVPTTLLTLSNGEISNIVMEALDLSQINTTICFQAVTTGAHLWMIRDCKLHASAVPATTPTFPGQIVQLARSSA